MPELQFPTKCRRCGVYTQGHGYCSKCQAINDQFEGVREYLDLIDYTRVIADEMEKKGKR